MEKSSLDQNMNSQFPDFSLSVDITNLSPVSDLTVNLSSLLTSVAGTPIRRISWSNPVPGGDKIGIKNEDIPSSADSPIFQVLKPSTQVKSILSRENDASTNNKENINISSKVPLDSVTNDKEKELCLTDSQESGYKSVSSKTWRAKSSLFSTSSFNKCSFASASGDDSLDDIFLLDTSGDSMESTSFSENISNLITKPLIDCSNRSQKPTPGMKRGKLPIRRCLSMEMTSAIEQSFSEYVNSIPIEIPDETNHAITDFESKGKSAFKRPEPPNDLNFHSKRRKSSPCVEALENLPLNQNFKFKRSYSETATTIMHAIIKSDLQPELIGDGTRSYALPVVKGRHNDLKSISPDTMAHLLIGSFKEEVQNFVLVDCRYPYEFKGGHIQGAKNIFSKDEVLNYFFDDSAEVKEKSIVIFHCEFSSERAPNLCRFMRNKDRELNQGNYPHLRHPEMYILEGGYKAFYESYKELCEPQNYKPMNHKDHGFELRHFRAKSKSWGADSKGRVQFRSNSIVSDI